MKAILVVDIDDCEDIANYGASVYHYPSRKFVQLDVPFKPMPQKESEKHREEIEDWTGLAYSQGWNACLEELEKPETKSDLSTDEGWWRDYELYEMQND